MAEAIPTKKDKAGGITGPDFKLHHSDGNRNSTGLAMKTDSDQQNRTDGKGIIQVYMFNYSATKEPRIYNRERTVSSGE